DRIRQLRNEGTTLLLVSHDRTAIQSICDRALLLDAGKAVKDGTPEEVMDYYNALVAERETRTVRQHAVDGGKVQTVSGTGEATVTEVALLDEHGARVEDVKVGQPVSLAIEVEVREDLPELVVGYVIKDRLGQQVYGTNTHHLERPLERIAKGERIRLRFGFDANLGDGSYSVAIALHTGATHVAKNYEWRDLALIFRVVAPPA